MRRKACKVIKSFLVVELDEWGNNIKNKCVQAGDVRKKWHLRTKICPPGNSWSRVTQSIMQIKCLNGGYLTGAGAGMCVEEWKCQHSYVVTGWRRWRPGPDLYSRAVLCSAVQGCTVQLYSNMYSTQQLCCCPPPPALPGYRKWKYERKPSFQQHSGLLDLHNSLW